MSIHHDRDHSNSQFQSQLAGRPGNARRPCQLIVRALRALLETAYVDPTDDRLKRYPFPPKLLLENGPNLHLGELRLPHEMSLE